MFQQDYHSDMHKLSTQQHVSLNKYRNMINSAHRWQQHSHSSHKAKKQPSAPISRFRVAFATILNIFSK